MHISESVGHYSNPGLSQATPQDRAIRKKHLYWLYGFLVATFLLQMALVPGFLFPIRTPLRVALFGASLAMLVAPLGSRCRLPVTTGVYVILGLFFVGLVHPDTNSLTAGLATIGLNLSIIAPILWVSRMRLDAKGLEGAMMLIWAFNFASTAFGVLEVVQPGRFSRESAISTQLLGDYAEGLKVTLADGTKIYRPMGLTDSPGGACHSGFFAVLLGSFFLYRTRQNWLRGMFLASIVGGLFCIYLSQVRSMLVLTVVCEFVVLVMFIRRGQMQRATSLVTVLVSMSVLATVWAFTIGGSQVSDRIKTLGEGSAASIYYSNRGFFLEDTIYNQLPAYPLGAGLGRWGMVNVYFSDKAGRAAKPLYVEIQPTAWVYDGGIPLLVAYYAVIIVACQFSYRIATTRGDSISTLAVMVLAHNLAILVNTCSSVPFIGQSGLYFWLLNACLMTVIMNEKRTKASQSYPSLPYDAMTDRGTQNAY